jgi:hypothetical protein
VPSRRGWLAAVSVVVVALGAWGARALWAGDAAAMRGGETALAVRQATNYRPDYAHVHGLFIGIGAAYAGTGWPSLANPVREVDAVIERLQANDPMWKVSGAVVRLCDQDATWQNIVAQLSRLRQEAEPEDAVLIYFAGHGTREEDSFGLCAADVERGIGNGTGYLRRDTLTSFAKACPAKHVLFVLDCCHSGAVFEVDRGRAVEAEGVRPGSHHRQRFSREFLCSAGAGQAAADGEGLSPFCRLLLDELGQPATTQRNFVAARHLAGRIGEAMDLRVARCGTQQVPGFHQDAAEAGSFVFLLAPAK